jgi:amino acid adenylation domain-containing protein
MAGIHYLDKLFIAADQKVKEREYWHNKLSGELTKSTFPYDLHKAGRSGGIVPGTVKFGLNSDLFLKLMKLSNRSDHILHMIMAAALAVLLQKYTWNGGNDVIIGCPIYKQDLEGEFVNTVLPLKNHLDNHMTFKEFLVQVRQTILEAMENYSYPVEVLVRELELSYTGAEGEEFPLFDVAVLVDNIQDRKYMEHIPTNMIFLFHRDGESIEGKVEYNQQRYLESTLEGILRHFHHLLDQVLANIDLKIGDIDILTGEEKQRLLEEFNNTRENYPQKTLHRWFEEQAVQSPDHIAVTHTGYSRFGTGEKHSLTYRRLNRKANQLARLLQSKGVGPNTIVGIILEPSLDLMVGILAILKAGGAYLSIDHEYPGERIISILDDSGASLLLTRSGIRKKYSFTALQGLQSARVEPHMTAVRPQADFDRIPHPDRSMINLEKYSRYIGHAMVRHAISIQGTRGCPYNCAYCHRTMQKRNVPRSAENIFEEVNYFYQRGVRRFAFVDEIFNLHEQNSMRFFRMVLQHKMKVQLFFPNGMRADRLTREYIDLMVEAGTVNVGLALESASPRLQKLIQKNLDIEKLRENAAYFCSQYPQVILELFTMHGFPTETEEEAMATLNFIKSFKWIHFPYVFLLKIHPSTDMMKLALDSGVPRDAIERSMTAAFHEIPETLPFPKSFTRQYVAQFMNDYFLNKERLLHVLPHQMKIASENELVGKYDNYLPADIKSFNDIIANVHISREELGDARLLTDESPFIPDYEALRKSRYMVKPPAANAFRILLLDLSVLFTTDKKSILHNEITEPLGLMYLLTYLRETFKERIHGRMYQAKIDFDSYKELKPLVCDFRPHLIGIRTLSYFKDFFHRTAALIREWGITAPLIAGGPYGTSDYHLVLQDPQVALTVLKEGELTLAQLVEKMMGNDYQLPAEEVLETIPGIAFIKNQDKKRLTSRTREMVCSDKWMEEIASFSPENLHNTSKPGDLLYLISTSGSTGKPKSVMLEHRNLANLMHFQFIRSGIDFKRVLQFASIGFDVSAQEIFSTLLWGGELCLVDSNLKRDIPQLLDLIEKNRVNVLFLPPAFLKFIFSDLQYREKFPVTVRHIIAAGEQLVVGEHFRNYLQRSKACLHNHYGPSETHVVTALTLKPGDVIEEFPTIGTPISNTRVYILDENRKPKPTGAVGELYIAGAAVGRGYFKRKELTEERFTTDPFEGKERMYRTGDLARWLPNGAIAFLGRSDNQVKIRGYRIELGEIERSIIRQPSVKEAVVVESSHETGDKYLCAYLVSDEPIDPTELRAALLYQLPDYMIPAHFIRIPSIPLTTNGKVDKKKLPLPAIEAGDDFVSPQDELEKKLAEIWAEVLEIEKEVIGIDANFFELGGHSLKATVLISKLHRQLRVKMQLVEVFQSPTIRELARTIKVIKAEEFTPIPSVEKREFYEVSYHQKRLWYLGRGKIRTSSYNLPGKVTLRHRVDHQVIKEVFRELTQRHESFRTTFLVQDDQLVQVIEPGVEIPLAVIDLSSMAEPEKEMERGNIFNREMAVPFDISRPPLFRAALVKLGKEKYDLIYNMHHIISDGWSNEVLKQEFSLIYEALQGGRKNPLKPLNLQYKDYGRWHNNLLADTEKIKSAREYWKGQLHGEIPPVDLPYDYPRNNLASKDSADYRVMVPEKVAAGLRTIGLEHHATLFMVMLTAFNMLLAYIARQEDIVVGVPAAGRQHEDLKNIIGFFVNTLVLINRVNPDETFIQFLSQVQDNTLKTLEYQNYPLELICGELKIKYPEISVFFNMSGFGNPRQEEVENVAPRHLDQSQPPKFDMVFYIQENKNGIELRCHYFKELFLPETIEKITGIYMEMLAGISIDPGKPLGNYHRRKKAKGKLIRGI